MTEVGRPEHGQQRADLIDALTVGWRAHTDDASSGASSDAASPDLPAQFFGGVSTDDLSNRSTDELLDVLASHWALSAQRRVGESIVRCLTPAHRSGASWTSASYLHVVTEDMPFLVDSVALAARRRGHSVELIIHPVLRIHRTRDGRATSLVALGPNESVADASESSSAWTESHMLFELERIADERDRLALETDVLSTLGNVRAAVTDWPLLRARARSLADDIATHPEDSAAPSEREEGAALLRWMADDHFTLLGAADFALSSSGLTQISGTGLGIMADPLHLSFVASSDWDGTNVLLLTKTEIQSNIHRPGPYDVVGTKTYNNGVLTGERRIIGFFTSEAYLSSPSMIPVLRRKVDAIVHRSGISPTGHAGKELRTVLEGYPRDELFAASIDQLLDTAFSVVQLQERRRVRLFTRFDVHRRAWTALVYLPRDRYSTDVRRRIEAILLESFGAISSEFSISLTESSLARVYFVLHLRAGASPFAVDQTAVERELSRAVRSWSDSLRDELVALFGGQTGAELFTEFGQAFPADFREAVTPQLAVDDVVQLARVLTTSSTETHIQVWPGAPAGEVQLKIYVPYRQIDLADLLPMLANLGLRVLDERSTEVRTAPHTVWIHDLSVTCDGVDLTTAGVEKRINEAFIAMSDRRGTDDGFNRLVLKAALDWREVQVLRAYASYLRQLSFPLSQSYVEATLVEQADVAANLVSLFTARFDPDLDATIRALSMEEIRTRITARLADVASLDQDRILRALLGLIDATLRTNWFQLDRDGNQRAVFGIKLAPEGIVDAPLPRPKYEIYMHSPLVEGVHLRMGSVARGGLRWSERPEDFRTEVLGLMKAQAVKNAVIVPAGAKGGFIVKRTLAERQAMQDEIVACYRLFIATLLDLTDNLIGGAVIAPSRTVRHDGDDPYLVVAADKGTATFSDIANSIAIEHGFWLGDAFASGGSVGYDHKAMAITARGAWESVKHHLRRLGREPADPITTMGIGDMSGDVFGNGMLLSEHIALIGAFDHRHIMIDPTPDAARTYAERQRLFSMPRSSWDDFDRAALSAGGGIWPRTAKSISLGSDACAALGVDGPASFSPTELISMMLKAPVDLLWNGGIGTYVKSGAEPQSAAGDRANDGLRVDARDLRCRIVGEGGNLGFTQRARVEFARRGGLINTDAIDNSAGVDTSDHEVNLKILLDQAVHDGGCTVSERNALLASMTNEVAVLVLADNIDQNQALVNGITLAGAMIDVHARYLTYLERAARLDRPLEALPDTDALLERKAQGAGLVAPELAVVMAYTKLHLTEQLLVEAETSDEAFTSALTSYFPAAIRDQFAANVAAHPLRAEITATSVANEMVNRNGVTFAFRLAEETQASVTDIARAHITATQLFRTDDLWRKICLLTNEVAEDVIVALLLEVDRLVERASRWVLRHRPLPLDVRHTVTAFRPGVDRVVETLASLVSDAERELVERRVVLWTQAGVPQTLAAEVAALDLAPAALDIVRLSLNWSTTGDTAAESIDPVASVYFTIDDQLGLGDLRDRIVALPRDDRWDALARAALRDDLAGEHAALTSAVIMSDPALAITERFAAWASKYRVEIERHLATVREVQESGVGNVATMSVVLRGLRSLATSR